MSLLLAADRLVGAVERHQEEVVEEQTQQAAEEEEMLKSLFQGQRPVRLVHQIVEPVGSRLGTWRNNCASRVSISNPFESGRR